MLAEHAHRPRAARCCSRRASRQVDAARTGRMDPRRPPAGALPDAAAQAAVGRRAGPLSDEIDDIGMTTRAPWCLVSGGMDSAVTLAIAREQGFACHALSVGYGQRHRAELDAADRAGASAARRGRAQDGDRRPAQHRRLGADRRHRRAGNAPAQRHPGHLRAGAQHHHAVDRAGLGRGAGRRRHLLRRQRRRLFRLSRLPPGIHRRLRDAWPTSPPRPASRAAAAHPRAADRA